MVTKIPELGLGLLVMGWSGFSVPAEVLAPAELPGKGYLLVDRLDAAPVIDGDLSEWPGVMTALALPGDCGSLGAGPSNGNTDLSALLRTGGDHDRLYLAVAVSDDKHNAPVGLPMWNRDHLRIAIDPLNEKTLGALGANDSELAFALLNNGATAFNCVRIPHAPGSNNKEVAISRASAEVDLSTYIPDAAESGIHFAARRTASETIYEVGIPWTTLGVPAGDGSVCFGFNLVVAENDGLGRQNWIEMAPGLVPAAGMERDASQYLTAASTTALLLARSARGEDRLPGQTAKWKTEIRERLSSLRLLLAEVEQQEAKARKRGIATDYEMISIATGREFIEYGLADLSGGLTAKSEHVAEIVGAALDEADDRLQRYLSGEAKPLLVPRFRTGPVEVRNGQFWGNTLVSSTGVRERRPVFFMGYGFFSKVIDDIPKFEALGCNIIQSAREGGGGGTVIAQGTVSDSISINSVPRAAAHNVVVDWHSNTEYFPHWARNKWPELEGAGGAFYDIKVDAPQARDIFRLNLRACLKVIGDNPGLLSVCLMNEPTSEFWDRDQFRLRLWRDHLERVHGTIENVNALEGTGYKSFEEVPVHSTKTVPPDEEMTPLRYEQIRFNMDRFAEFHRFLSDVIHKARPGTLVHTKAMAMLERDALHFGTDPDQFGFIGDLNGADTWCKYIGEGERYATLWWRQNISFDVQRSLRAVPIINSENHIIAVNEPREIPPAHTDCVLWQGCIHGMAASINWVWEHYYEKIKVENPPDYYGGDTFNAVLTRPENVMAVGKVGLDLMRLAPEVYKMQAATSPVAIMYGITAQIWSERADRALKLAYEAMSFNGFPVVFVSERQVREGGLSRFRAVVLPSIRHGADDVARRIAEYAGAGGTLWIIGDPAEALAYDEYGRPRRRDLPHEEINTWPENTPPSDLRRSLLRAFDAADIQRHVLLKDEDDLEPWAIDYRAVPDGNGYLVSMANYWGTPKRVRITVDGKTPTKLWDLRSEKPIIGPSIELKSLQALLLRAER